MKTLLLAVCLTLTATAQQNITLTKELPGGVVNLGTVATPTVDNDTGTYSGTTVLTFSDATAGAVIWTCSSAGTDCTPDSPTNPVTVTTTGTHACAVAKKSNYTDSAAKCATITINLTPTYTTAQHVVTACSTNTACTITIAATTAGNLGILCGGHNSGSGVNVSSTPTNEGTWVHTPNVAVASTINQAASQFYAADCYHSLSLTGGVTSITFNWTGDSPLWNSVAFTEVSRSSGSWTLDTSLGSIGAACSSCSAPSVTLSGTDYVYHFAGGTTGATFSSISGSPEFTSYVNYDGGSNLNTGVSSAFNPQSAYIAPTYTMNASDKLPVIVMAFK